MQNVPFLATASQNTQNPHPENPSFTQNPYSNNFGPVPTGIFLGSGRELTELSKIYFDDMKYGGSDDRLDFKLSIFYNLCKRARLTNKDLLLAVPIMLKRNALEYYFRSIDPKITPLTTFDDVILMIRNNFEGTEHKQSIFQK